MLLMRLEPRQSQRLVITPQLRQAIKLLELSALDLQAHIDNELRENPLLSIDERPNGDVVVPGTAPEFNGEMPAFDVRTRDFPLLGLDWTQSDAQADSGTASTDEIPEHRSTDWSLHSRNQTATGTTGDYDPLSSIARPVSLGDHLRSQARLVPMNAQERFIADYLIDLTDRDGYIRVQLPDVAAALSATRPEIDRVVSILQTFDPAGVCARSLAECLALQLKERNRFDPLMERLLNHLDLLAQCDYARLRKVCGVDAEDLASMIEDIRALDPKPGAAFEKPSVETLVPDVIVKRDRAGGWRIDLNPASAPALAVDRAYYRSLKTRCRSDADRAYLSERMTAANWLAKSLEQRVTTILKVATALVEEQSAFFEHGVRYLRPLNLRQIADKIGMHESTVSRVTSNKAMATPRGTFDMKYFFTSSIQPTRTAAAAHSSEAVRDRIREMIANENAGNVLSDDKLVTMLREDGIEIARRTVAKYREAMRIPSSASRRRKMRLN